MKSLEELYVQKPDFSAYRSARIQINKAVNDALRLKEYGEIDRLVKQNEMVVQEWIVEPFMEK